MQHCRETVFFHHGCYMFAHQSSTPRLEIVNPPDGYCLTLGSQKHFRSVENHTTYSVISLNKTRPAATNIHKYLVTHLQPNSVKVDQQTQSADKLCRKYHPTSMFGNSSAVQNRTFPLYPHVFPKIVPWFSHIFLMKLAILGISPPGTLWVSQRQLDWRRPRLRLGCWVTHGQFKRFFWPSMLVYRRV